MTTPAIRNRAWRERNIEHARALTRESVARWRAAHPEESRSACRSYHTANRAEIAEQKRDYYQRVRKHADKTEEGRLADRNRKARRRAASGAGHVSAEEWLAILSAHDHACAYCQASSLPLEMDHVVPLSKGGDHAATNIVPACKPCNSRKGGR